jgi:hypothetical protein
MYNNSNNNNINYDEITWRTAFLINLCFAIAMLAASFAMQFAASVPSAAS